MAIANLARNALGVGLPLGEGLSEGPNGVTAAAAAYAAYGVRAATLGDYIAFSQGMPACTVNEVRYSLSQSANASGTNVSIRVRKDGVDIVNQAIPGTDGAIAAASPVLGTLAIETAFAEGEKLDVYVDTNSDNISSVLQSFMVKFTPA